MSLMRTSVISTAVLLLEPESMATRRGVDLAHAAHPQAVCHASCVQRGTAQAKVARAAAAHLRSQHVLTRELSTQPVDPGRKFGRRLLEPIVQQPPGSRVATGPESCQQFISTMGGQT